MWFLLLLTFRGLLPKTLNTKKRLQKQPHLKCVFPCRLSETCVATGYKLGDQELTRAVYTRLVDTREEELCVHPGGNFIIQRLLDNIGDKEEFLELAERLGALLETVLASGCSGVVLSLVSGMYRVYRNNLPKIKLS